MVLIHEDHVTGKIGQQVSPLLLFFWYICLVLVLISFTTYVS